MEEHKKYILKEKCDFEDVFEHIGEVADSLSGLEKPLAEIGYVRADYDGKQWWGNYFPTRNALRTNFYDKESQEIYSYLTTKFYNLEQLRLFYEKHPSAETATTEYCFYINGDIADYRVRLITREKDYNIYLYAYAKDWKPLESI